jgi:hypothetical protein
MMATGVASMSGQGVATTRIARTRTGSRVMAYAIAQVSRVIGVNQTA